MRKYLLALVALLATSVIANAQVFGTGNVPQFVFGVAYSPSYTYNSEEGGYTDKVAPFFNYQVAYEGTMFGVLARYGRTNFQRTDESGVNDYTGNLFFLGGSMCVNLGGNRFGVDSHIPGIALEYRNSPAGNDIGLCFYGSIRGHFYVTRKVAVYAEVMGLISRMQCYVQPVAGISIQL